MDIKKVLVSIGSVIKRKITTIGTGGHSRKGLNRMKGDKPYFVGIALT